MSISILSPPEYVVKSSAEYLVKLAYMDSMHRTFYFLRLPVSLHQILASMQAIEDAREDNN